MVKKFTYPQPTQKYKVRWGRILVLLAFLAILLFVWKKIDVSEPNLTPTQNASTQNPAPVASIRDASPEPNIQALPPKQADPVPAQTGSNLATQTDSPTTAGSNASASTPLPTNGDSPQQAVQAPLAPPTKPNNLKPALAGKSPFADKSLEQITATIATNRFIGENPQSWGETLPGITTHLSHVWQEVGLIAEGNHGVITKGTAPAQKSAQGTLALTLDACGGKPEQSFDEELIDFLEQEQIPATIFVTSKWIKSNPLALDRLAQNPLFEIASHGTNHKPASINGRSVYEQKGTASLAELVKEVEENARHIEKATGKRPRWVRSGTAFYDDIALAVISKLNLGIAGYSLSADEGATLSADKVARKTLQAKDGYIILAHLNHPKSGTAEGLIKALTELKAQGFAFTTLSPRQ